MLFSSERNLFISYDRQVFWLVIFSPSRYHQWPNEKIRPLGRAMTLQLRGQPRNFTGFPFLPT